MRRSKPPAPTFDVFSELWESLGRVPPERIRMQPPPGTATEEDVIAAESRYNRLCELIDGTLVEKTVGWYESRVASVVGWFIETYAVQHDLGFAFGEAGMIRVEPGRVRMPDVSFLLWSHFPGRILPKGQILNLIPDLAVEVLSPKNTPAELERKRREYFLGGCKLVWEIDPVKKTVRVYTAPDESRRLGEKGKLSGGDVLPGFELLIADLFAQAGQRPTE
jgi:Uma2 family endonuclease